MKAPITKENRAKFSANYYGQKVLFDGIEEVITLDGYHLHQMEEIHGCGYMLDLIHLKDIADGHADDLLRQTGYTYKTCNTTANAKKWREIN